jgi:hypothetical protein
MVRRLESASCRAEITTRGTDKKNASEQVIQLQDIYKTLSHMRQSFVVVRLSTLVLPLLVKSVSLTAISESGRVRMKTILLLEDNDDRIAGFKSVVHEFGGDWQVRVWRDALTMLAEWRKEKEPLPFISNA